MAYQTPQLLLSDLMSEVSAGKLQLPDFQRDYKWDDERIQSLLATLTLGHPMGVIMMLETGNDQVRFKPKLLAGVEAGSAEDPYHLLLDGQQRLTSLFQALASGKPVETMDVRKKKLSRWYYLDIHRALGDPIDRDTAIVSVPKDRVTRSDFGRVIEQDLSTPDKERAAAMFPMSLIFDQSGSVDWLVEYANTGDPSDTNRLATFKAFQAQVLGPATGYRIPAIVLGKDTTKDAVCTVFEKVNTGGLALDVFELLTATFAGDADYYRDHGDDFRLNDDWAAIKQRLAPLPVLKDVKSSDFLQAITLLTTKQRRDQAIKAGVSDPPGTTARRADVLKLSLGDYLHWAPDVVEGLEWAAHFLTGEKIFVDGDLPYRTQLVPLAVLRVVMGADIDVHSQNQKVRRWYWSGVLGELYGGAVETRFSRDVEQVPDWATGKSTQEPETVARAGFRESRLLSLKTRNSSAYKGLSALMLRQGATDWKHNQEMGVANFISLNVDIHHIFPKAWCERMEIDANERDCIVNKTPISYQTNRSIGGRAPATYIARLERDTGLSGEELDRVIAGHHIQPQTLRANDFEAFFNARIEAIVVLVEEAMGKPVARDLTNPDESTDIEAEGPQEFDDDEAAEVDFIRPNS